MKTIGTCSDCAYWGRHEYRKEGGACASPKLSYDASDPPRDALHYWDYEDYNAGMATGPDFGCIHWEIKK